jgi:hypothetical protein
LLALVFGLNGSKDFGVDDFDGIGALEHGFGSPVNLKSLENKGCPGERLKRPISLGGTLPGGWRRTREKFFAAIPRQYIVNEVRYVPIASCVPSKCSPACKP